MSLLEFIKLRQPKYHKELERCLNDVENNAANNYKDAAQLDFKKFTAKFEELKADGKLSEKQILYYDEKQAEYEKKLKNFHH